jgi:hypothetical protein
VKLQLLLDNLQIVEVAERFLKHGACIEILDLLRAAGPILQLLGRVALDDHRPAGLERLAHAGAGLQARAAQALLAACRMPLPRRQESKVTCYSSCQRTCRTLFIFQGSVGAIGGRAFQTFIELQAQ